MDDILGLMDDLLDDENDSGKGPNANLAELYSPDLDISTTLQYQSGLLGDLLSDLNPNVTNINQEEHSELLSAIEAVRNFDIIGDPEEDMEHWHKQTYADTCAVVSQEFILDELTGRDFTEDELRQQATDNGWYIPGGGTPLECMGNLLEAHGIKVEKSYDQDINSIEKCLEAGQKVMVAVNGDEIWNTGESSILSDFFGIPNDEANHAIEVIGVDRSDPQQPMVILNDPGTQDGKGLEVSLETFDKAWATSDHFMVATNGQTTPTVPVAGIVGSQMLGGYTNADGTYHWTSDNTDTDPQTGKIVRRW